MCSSLLPRHKIYTAQDHAMQVDSDSEDEVAKAPAKECLQRKTVMTAVKQVPARVPEGVSTQAAALDADDNARNAQLPRVDGPQGAVPKSLAGALPEVPAPPSNGHSDGGLPPEILAKLRELEEVKAKYAAVLLKKEETEPDKSLPPEPAQLLRKDSTVSPPEQKQVFTPESSSSAFDSVAPEAGSGCREDKSQETPQVIASQPLSPVDEEILQEAYNLEHKDAIVCLQPLLLSILIRYSLLFSATIFQPSLPHHLRPLKSHFCSYIHIELSKPKAVQISHADSCF